LATPIAVEEEEAESDAREEAGADEAVGVADEADAEVDAEVEVDSGVGVGAGAMEVMFANVSEWLTYTQRTYQLVCAVRVLKQTKGCDF
jgi:hypothetical protein